MGKYGKIHCKWPCSIAMLNYQRVNHIKSYGLHRIPRGFHRLLAREHDARPSMCVSLRATTV